MKLYGLSGNPNVLKVLSACYECGFTPEVIQESYFKAPGADVVLVSKELLLFDPNVILLYLYSKTSSEYLNSLPTEWLTWENEVLYPALLSAYGSGKVDELIPLLEPKIENLSGILNVLLWADLYPLLTDQEVSKKMFSLLDSLKSWFLQMETKPSFVKALKILNYPKGLKSAKSELLKLKSYTTLVESQVTDTDKISPDEICKVVSAWLNVPNTSTKKVEPLEVKSLPVKGQRNILITSALPYVNNVPHLGNITGAVLSADVYARFCRLRGYNVLYICGTDEHGTTTETKALAEGVTPKEICDKYHALHSEIYSWFDISFNHFGRTTKPENKTITQETFLQLKDKGCIIEDSMDQLWCEKCSQFLADRFVVGTCPLCSYDGARGDQCDACGKLINAVDLLKPKCSSCSASPDIKTSKHLFLDLPNIEKRLENWMVSRCSHWSSNAVMIAKSWLKLGLQPRCITRDLKWGIPVPLEGYENKVFYVWFDAPIGYAGITAEYTEQWKEWWQTPENKVELVQFMGKDNVPFHSVIFPAIQLGSQKPWTMVSRIFSTEYLNYEDSKFSKSRGIGVFGNDVQKTGIESDVWRFYLMYTRPESQDSAFKWSDLLLKNNSELLGNLGNFVNRSLKFCKDFFGGVVADVRETDLTEESCLFIARVARNLDLYIQLLESGRERDSVSQILNVSRWGNQYMQSKAPWKLVKGSSKDKLEAHVIVSICVQTVSLLCSMVSPFMPGLASKISNQLKLNQIPNLTEGFTKTLEAGHKIGVPEPLIKELKPDEIKAFEEKYAGSQDQRAQAEKASKSANPEQIENLTAQVIEQGNKVRALKEEKAPKEKIDEQVKKLLDLKKQLALISGSTSEPSKKPKSSKKKSDH